MFKKFSFFFKLMFVELSLGSGYQATGNTNVGHYLGGLGVIGDEPYILGKFVTLDFGERGVRRGQPKESLSWPATKFGR